MGGDRHRETLGAEDKGVKMKYIAHVRPQDGEVQTVAAHLNGTAERCEAFAAAFGCGALGRLTGLLHDVGKYQLSFQRRINGETIRVDHATPGAKAAAETLKNPIVALCVAGHHGGMPDAGNRALDTDCDVTLFGRMKREMQDYDAYKTEIIPVPAAIPDWARQDGMGTFMLTHMLFSCLVDADYLDTEAFMQGAASRGGGADMAALRDRLQDYTKGWDAPASDINKRRTTILRALEREGKTAETGVFTLSVPTGGGKTVSSVAFAIEHALARGLRRILYVIPYTSIIEQTQLVFEKIFGKENVVAHYANVEYDTDENGNIADPRRLAAENWDAPIILTTNVQFFESLFSNRPGRCRKLHNIAESVMIFDEAQMLPMRYLLPCVSAIAQLVKNYHCSAVLCTATQPALDGLIDRYGLLPGAQISELCPDMRGMYDAFRRVRYESLGEITDEALIAHAAAKKGALVIVNTRRHAQTLYRMLPGEGTYHLSTTMCPAHRRRMLDAVKRRLKAGEPCYVFSTSLVEAGVDVDFPAVYRALAGLDSIIQAGGRCNREGGRSMEESVVYLFNTGKNAPRGMERNLAVTTRIMETYDDIASPEAIRAYFEFLYYICGDEALDSKQVLASLRAGVEYRTVAERFRLIENDERTVFVPYGEGKALVALLEKWENITRGLMRRAGQYAVSVRAGLFAELCAAGAIEPISEDAAVLRDMTLYDGNTGLALDAERGKAEFV